MADKSTWIKLDRNILNWKWFTDPVTLQVFIWLLVKANVADNGFKGETIKRGSVATSYQHIAESCGITYSQARTAVKHLIVTGEVTHLKRLNYSVISIVNYTKYQGMMTDPKTNPSQNDDKSIAEPSQQYKNIKNIENGRSIKATPREIPGMTFIEQKPDGCCVYRKDSGGVYIEQPK